MKKTTKATFGIIGLSLFSGASTASADVESLLDDCISGEISAGWDSRYFFRGLWFGDETAWTNIEVSTELASNLTGSVNVFYTEVLDEQVGGSHFAYSEANVGATLSYDAGFGTFDLGFLHYRFFDGFAGTSAGVPSNTNPAGNTDASEVSLGYSQDIIWGFSLSLLYAYDFRIDASYAELGLGYSHSFNDSVGIDFGATAGYSIDDYYASSLGAADGEDFTHVLLTLALPIQLTESATLTPHVSANISLDARDDINAGVDRGDTEVYYGASFGVSF